MFSSPTGRTKSTSVSSLRFVWLFTRTPTFLYRKASCANTRPSVLNGLTVKYFGISEFYMSIFKIFLMLGLMMYTFVTMVGGNPDRDPYGFRYWRDPVRQSFVHTYYWLLFKWA
jgi:amino acid permease